MLQFSSIDASPLHVMPSAGVKQARVLVRVPPPHGLLQVPRVQSDQTSLFSFAAEGVGLDGAADVVLFVGNNVENENEGVAITPVANNMAIIVPIIIDNIDDTRRLFVVLFI